MNQYTIMKLFDGLKWNMKKYNVYFVPRAPWYYIRNYVRWIIICTVYTTNPESLKSVHNQAPGLPNINTIYSCTVFIISSLQQFLMLRNIIQKSIQEILIFFPYNSIFFCNGKSSLHKLITNNPV